MKVMVKAKLHTDSHVESLKHNWKSTETTVSGLKACVQLAITKVSKPLLPDDCNTRFFCVFGLAEWVCIVKGGGVLSAIGTSQ